MFEATRSRSWAAPAAMIVVAAVVTAVWWTRPSLLQRVSVLVGGGNPLAEPFATERVDQVFPESPLAVSLALEAGFAPVEREAVLAFADDLARDLGFWLLETTGAHDIEDAERRLWATGDGDRFAVAWALRLQDRHLYSRHEQRLSGSLPPAHHEDPRYAHPDELVLLLAHVAWRLDLASDLIRSPVHHYVVLREPGGTRARGVEPTCFRRVDALGHVAPSDEASVGRRLSFPPDHYPSGVGGIRNPDPVPPGIYQPVSASELTGDLFARLAARYDADAETLGQQLVDHPTSAVAQAVYRLRMARGIAAWEAGDAETTAKEGAALAELRTDQGSLLADAPDERVLDAAAAFVEGDRERGFDGVQAVLRYHEPDGPVLFAKSDAHAMAMWLELEYGLPTPEDWNRRIVPLLNRNRDNPAQIARLCTIGRRVLADTKQTVEELVPECSRAGP